jgi:hypothetical protein
MMLKMKKAILITLLLFVATVASAQKKEKIRGSKIVTVEQPEVAHFDNLEVFDNFEIFLIKGEKCALEIEADDNLHEVISAEVTSNTLRLSTTKDVSGAKKLSVRVTYTNSFKMAVSRDDSNVTALAEVNLDDATFKCYDNSRLFINANIKNFTLITNDKSKTELNLKSDDAVLELSTNSTVKALIAAPKIKCDMYQRASATIEGDVDDFKLRMDNNSTFIGKKLTAKNVSLIMEGSSKATVFAVDKLSLEASGKSEIFFHGNGKLDVKRFVDDVSLHKRSR